MEPLKIVATEDTPAITFDKEENIFELSGRSLPEDVNSFFEPIINWIEAYREDALDQTVFDFKLEYFNTASSKLLLDLLMLLEEIQEDGASEITVNWYYHEDDEDMEEAGEEYAELVEITFELKPIKDEDY